MIHRLVAHGFILIALLGSHEAAASTSPVKIAVFTLENKSGLAQNEADFLTKAVISSVLNQGIEGSTVVQLESAAGGDKALLAAAAAEVRADHFVSGQILDFDEGRAVAMELFRTEGPVTLAAETTTAMSDASALIQATKDAAASLVAVLKKQAAPTIIVASTHEPRPTPRPRPTGYSPTHYNPSPVLTGTLRVSSVPPQANVYIGGTTASLGPFAGHTPLSKQLRPRRYWLRVTAKGHDTHMEAITIFAGETVTRKILLTPNVSAATALKSNDPADFQWARLIISGHSLLWPGLAGVIGSVAFSLAGNMDFTSGTILCASFGTMAMTGVILAIAGTVKKTKRMAQKRRLAAEKADWW